MTYRGFVVLGVMRTGSNLLEETLNTVPHVICHGELFNPHFVGGPNRDGLWGVDKKLRDADPIQLLNKVWAAEDLNGFRLFADHDPRVLDAVLNDASIAKIVLTRRPIESYVSLAMAKATGQWWLGQAKSARTAKVRFDAAGYAAYLEDLTAFYRKVRVKLQLSGQTAFWLDYQDLKDDEVLAGLAWFLGQTEAPDAAQVRAKIQNPKALSDLLTNPEEAETALVSGLQPDLEADRQWEPARGPGVRGFVATESGLLYMPIPGAGPDPIAASLTGERDLRQKDLRRWMRQNRRHRSFTLVRDPLARAHDAFTHAILPKVGPMPDIRHLLTKDFDVRVPDDLKDPGYSLTDHQRAFAGFLDFLEGNLSGQSAVPVQRVWASQHMFVTAMAGLRPPDRILRDVELPDAASDFPELVRLPVWQDTSPFSFAETATPRHRELALRAYRRDYLTFGLMD